MRGAWSDFQQAGAELAVVGSGALRYAESFKDTYDLDFEVLTDPSLEAYKLAELQRGITSTFSPRGFGYAFRTLRKGHRQGRTQGDPWQLGGAFVITPSGEIPFAHISAYTGDHAKPEDILAALA